MKNIKRDNIHNFLKDFEVLLEKYEGKVSFGISEGIDDVVCVVDDETWNEHGYPDNFADIPAKEFFILNNLKKLNRKIAIRKV